jgi:hypothetical protein
MKLSCYLKFSRLYNRRAGGITNNYALVCLYLNAVYTYLKVDPLYAMNGAWGERRYIPSLS